MDNLLVPKLRYACILYMIIYLFIQYLSCYSWSVTTQSSKMELFKKTVNSFQQLTAYEKRSKLDA